MSASEILLMLNWILELDIRQKFKTVKFPEINDSKLKRFRFLSYQHPLFWFFLVFAAVHVVWLLSTQNMDYGMNDLFKKLPLLAIPIVVLTSRPLNKQQLSLIMSLYVLSVFVATIIGRVRYATMPDLPYREIIPYISHIRFSLNVCLAVVFLVAFMVVGWKRYIYASNKIEFNWYWLVEAFVAAVVISLLGFLLIIRSYTAMVILFVVGIILIAVFWHRIVSHTVRIAVLLFFLVLIGTATGIFFSMSTDYYRMIPLARQPLPQYTANGNPYSHQQNGLVENGNYVDNYVCIEELQSEWAKIGTLGLGDTTVNGYAVFPTLIRYLNAKGVTKDSVGMQVLTAADVQAIEKGIANPVYLTGSSLRRMVYVLLYEYESSRCLNAVKNFTVLQRLELWRNGWRVFTKCPLFGTGTGDVVDACHIQLSLDNSALKGTTKHIHNQYLTLLVTFGIFGFLIIAITFVWALRRERILDNPIVLAYLAIVLISFVSEDTLETLAGAVFSVLFMTIFAAQKKELKSLTQ